MNKNPSALIFLCILLCEVHISSQSAVGPLIENDSSNIKKALKIEGVKATLICPRNGCFPHEVLCERYYNCSSDNPTPEIWECRKSSDLLFNDQLLECDYAAYVHCGQRTRPDDVSSTMRPPIITTTTSSSTATSPPSISTSIGTTARPNYNCTTNGAYPHEKFCEKYYDCWEGTATLLTCPNNTLFDVQEQWNGCAPPSDVNCGERYRPIPGPIFECPENSKDGELYPDPRNCGAFFTCTHMHPVHQFCPLGLYFNKFLTVCDFPENVDCSDRQ